MCLIYALTLSVAAYVYVSLPVKISVVIEPRQINQGITHWKKDRVCIYILMDIMDIAQVSGIAIS